MGWTLMCIALITVSMDVTAAMTIHDHPWMGTTVHSPHHSIHGCQMLLECYVVLQKQEFGYTEHNAMVKVYGTTGYS